MAKETPEERLLQRIPQSDVGEQWGKLIDQMLDARATADDPAKANTRITYLRTAVTFIEFLIDRYSRLPTFAELGADDMREAVPNFLALHVKNSKSKDRNRRASTKAEYIAPSAGARQMRLNVITALYDFAGFMRLMASNPAREYRALIGKSGKKTKGNSEDRCSKALNKKELSLFFQAIRDVSLNGNRSEAIREAIVARNELWTTLDSLDTSNCPLLVRFRQPKADVRISSTSRCFATIMAGRFHRNMQTLGQESY